MPNICKCKSQETGPSCSLKTISSGSVSWEEALGDCSHGLCSGAALQGPSLLLPELRGEGGHPLLPRLVLPSVPWPPVSCPPRPILLSESTAPSPSVPPASFLCPLPLSESRSSGAPVTKSRCISLNPCSCLCSHISLEDPLLSLSPTPLPPSLSLSSFPPPVWPP